MFGCRCPDAGDERVFDIMVEFHSDTEQFRPFLWTEDEPIAG